MVEADTHVVWDELNAEGPKVSLPLFSWSYNNRKLLSRDSWRVTTPHVQSFVLISMLRSQPKTPPSGDDLAVLDYHLNPCHATPPYGRTYPLGRAVQAQNACSKI